MLKAVIDDRVPDNGGDALRRHIQKMREEQAKETGRREGYAEGYAEALAVGRNQAVEEMLELLLDFAKGNRS